MYTPDRELSPPETDTEEMEGDIVVIEEAIEDCKIDLEILESNECFYNNFAGGEMWRQKSVKDKKDQIEKAEDMIDNIKYKIRRKNGDK